MREDAKHRSGNYGALAGCVRVGGMLGNGELLIRKFEDAESSSRAEVFERLQRTQQQCGRISATAIREVAQTTSTCEAVVRSVATFYSMFDLDEAHEGEVEQTILRVCDGPSCCLLGGLDFMDHVSELAESDGRLRIARTSCLGLCDQSPAGFVACGNEQVAIGHVSTEFVPGLFSLLDAKESTQHPAPRLLGHIADPLQCPLTARFKEIDPRSIDSAIAAGAYSALETSLDSNPAQIIDEVESSELRGRGGAGFDTGKKWRMAADVLVDRRVVVCNADESEPGTFKDRMLMENDPHLLLEGMAICARAIGATEGYIYIRGEYVTAAETLVYAIAEARSAGYLGQNTKISEFSFDVHLHRGAGAYICGEETALLESLEGRRGEPRERPPYPTTSGYLGVPTVVNNVETFCAIPSIVNFGHTHFRDLGRDGAFGTKLFCLSGHIAQPGMCEAASGTSLREIIDQFGGGMANGQEFKLALTGGAAGTFVPESLLDLPLSHASWADGVAVGSGAIIVADQSVNAVEMLQWVLRFFEAESCGKCTPCRIGTTQARQLVDQIAMNGATDNDIERLLELARTLDQASLCGLGQSVAWPIESAIRHFRSDFTKN